MTELIDELFELLFPDEPESGLLSNECDSLDPSDDWLEDWEEYTREYE